MNAALIETKTAKIIRFANSAEMEFKKANEVKERKKKECYALELPDLKKIANYLKDNEQWIHYLVFVLSCNMARRIGDTLQLKWCNFYNSETGEFRRDLLEIVEDKTDKFANPHINQACREAINLYIEKTGCDVSANSYQNYVFYQMTGTHRGKVLSYDGYWRALKKAATACGIEYNIATHSPRKTFGMISKTIHPGDPVAMEMLAAIYNHSSEKVTRSYIGLTKKKIDAYYDDMGSFFGDYVLGDKKLDSESSSDKIITSLETSDLRELLTLAYQAGVNNANSIEPETHLKCLNDIMDIVESLSK